MRVNVDSAIFGDARLKRLAKVLGVPWTQALGCLVAVWHHCYQMREAVVSVDDVDIVADVDGLAAAMVGVGLGEWATKSRVRISGVTERIAWLEKQSEKSARGVEARRSRVNPATDPVVNPRVNPVVEPNGSPGGQPYSPSPSPSLALSNTCPPAADVSPRRKAPQVYSAEAADVSAYLLEAIRSHKADFAKSIAAWPGQADTLLKREGITVQRLKKAADQAHRHEWRTFWRKNILSVAKLGEQLEVLEIEMAEDAAKKRNGQPRQVSLEEAGYVDADEYDRRQRALRGAP